MFSRKTPQSTTRTVKDFPGYVAATERRDEASAKYQKADRAYRDAQARPETRHAVAERARQARIAAKLNGTALLEVDAPPDLKALAQDAADWRDALAQRESELDAAAMAAAREEAKTEIPAYLARLKTMADACDTFETAVKEFREGIEDFSRRFKGHCPWQTVTVSPLTMTQIVTYFKAIRELAETYTTAHTKG